MMVAILLLFIIAMQLGQLNQVQIETLIKNVCPVNVDYSISPTGNSVSIALPLTWGNASVWSGG